jgi:hypothetical protein
MTIDDFSTCASVTKAISSVRLFRVQYLRNEILLPVISGMHTSNSMAYLILTCSLIFLLSKILRAKLSIVAQRLPHFELKWKKSNEYSWQSLYISTFLSVMNLRSNFFCIWLTSLRENYVYVHSGNRISLRWTGIGKQQTSACQKMGVVANILMSHKPWD